MGIENDNHKTVRGEENKRRRASRYCCCKHKQKNNVLKMTQPDTVHNQMRSQCSRTLGNKYPLYMKLQVNVDDT
jgi:hypothetical protein